MPDPIHWQDPPPPGRPGGRTSQWEPVAARLRANPKRWARIATFGKSRAASASALANSINKGTPAWAPRGAFEAVSRKEDNGVNVYARYTVD